MFQPFLRFYRAVRRQTIDRAPNRDAVSTLLEILRRWQPALARRTWRVTSRFNPS